MTLTTKEQAFRDLVLEEDQWKRKLSDVEKKHLLQSLGLGWIRRQAKNTESESSPLPPVGRSLPNPDVRRKNN